MISLVTGKQKWYNEEERSNLARWCAIFLAKDEKELTELLSEEFMERDTSEKLMEEINDLCSDDEYVELYTDLSKRELEYNTYIEEAKIEGRNQGLADGRLAGFNAGLTHGKQEEKLEIAKNLLEQKIDINIISNVTGLTLDEINNLK